MSQRGDGTANGNESKSAPTENVPGERTLTATANIPAEVLDGLRDKSGESLTGSGITCDVPIDVALAVDPPAATHHESLPTTVRPGARGRKKPATDAPPGEMTPPARSLGGSEIVGITSTPEPSGGGLAAKHVFALVALGAVGFVLGYVVSR